MAAAAALAWGEWRGWPWLAGWSEGWLSGQFGRELRWRPPEAPSGSAPGWRLSLIGPLRLQAADLAVADPAGAAAARQSAPESLPAGWTLHARDLDLRLRWRDLLAWRRGELLRIEQVGIGHIAARLQREADGRANWLLERAADAPARPRPAVQIGTLWLREGRLAIDDRPLALQADAVFSLDEARREAALGRALAPAAAVAGARDRLAAALDRGRCAAAPVGFALSLEAGATLLRAQAACATCWACAARHRLHAVGAVAGAGGRAARPDAADHRVVPGAGPPPARAGRGLAVAAAVGAGRIGRSELSGDFVLDTAAARLQLGGTLRGRALWLADLGPAIGVPAQAAERQAAAADGRILPDRRFDPAFAGPHGRGADRLARPARAGRGLCAADRAAAGAAAAAAGGAVDRRAGRTGGARAARSPARSAWTRAARRRAGPPRCAPTGVPLEDWLRQTRASGAGPWISGRLSGDLLMQGQGRSTAELLASADGRLRLGITQGAHVAAGAGGRRHRCRAGAGPAAGR